MPDAVDPLEREAKERVAFYLALASTLIWFVVTFTVATLLDVAHSDRPARVIPLGFVVLAFSALPWLAYKRLVRSWVRRKLARQAPRDR
jgi:hypothetical protein